MSGIYGMLRLDGAPVSPDQLAVMETATCHYGPDGGGCWLGTEVGLGQHLLEISSEDRLDERPRLEPGLALVSAGRLDYREELWEELGVPTAERAGTANGALILEAYRRWGEGCVEHLQGDWAFALWDEKRRSLLLARDHHGNTALFFHRDNRRLAFSSSLKGLLALSDVPVRPDLLRVAQLLVSWPGDGVRTVYEGIEALPSAHLLLVSEAGVEKRRYWFPEKLAPYRFPRDQDYTEGLLEVLSRAVQARLRSSRPIAATLSGGLDSGAVVTLAASLLRRQGRTLTAFTAVPRYEPHGRLRPSRFGDEWELAHATARLAGVTEHHVERSERVGLMESIRRQLDIHQSPSLAVENGYWILAIAQAARALGQGVLLIGQQGNGSISHSGAPVDWSKLLRGDLLEIWKTLRESEPSLWLGVKRMVLKPVLLPVFRAHRYYLKGKGHPWSEYSAIDPTLAHHLALGRLMRQSGHDPTFTILPQAANLAALRIGRNSAGAGWHELGAFHGMEIRDPTADRRVVEFCIRCPNLQYRRKGEGRQLIRQAMEGRMPSEVLHSRGRGLQAADLVRRAMAERPALEATLESLKHSPLAVECLDLSRMEKLLQGLDPGGPERMWLECGAVLLRGLGMGMFLQRF